MPETKPYQFEVYCVHQPGEHYITHYHLPDQTVCRDTEKGVIDFEPMRPYIGKVFRLYMNGLVNCDAKLTDITVNEDGVPMMVYQPMFPLELAK